MRKICVVVTVELVVNLNDGVDASEALNEMDYEFTSTTKGATVIDSEITDFDIGEEKDEQSEAD